MKEYKIQNRSPKILILVYFYEFVCDPGKPTSKWILPHSCAFLRTHLRLHVFMG